MRPVPLLFLSLLWMALGGSFTLANFALGLGVAALSLRLVRGGAAARPPLRPRPIALLGLALFFLAELARAAWRVAAIVVGREIAVRPALFAYPLRLADDRLIALLANLITLTPGTLSVAVSHDRRTLFVHALHCPDLEAARAEIAGGFERRIGAAFG